MPAPQTLGRLRRIRRLGSGGFATVWLYRDEQLDSLVAVKVLADIWSERADIRERFVEEARILRRADSDHVVRVHDIGETDDGIPYFVMTYADQGTVMDLINDGPLPHLDEAVDLVTQAAEGLAVLHAQGIIHRDIKPQNLLLRSDDQHGRRLLIADLGWRRRCSTPPGSPRSSERSPTWHRSRSRWAPRWMGGPTCTPSARSPTTS